MTYLQYQITQIFKTEGKDGQIMPLCTIRCVETELLGDLWDSSG